MRMAVRASDLLRADHRQIEMQIDRLLTIVKHPNQEMVLQVRDVFAEIEKLMVAHFHKEEKVFYPYLRTTLGELLAQMDEQHEYIKEVAQGVAELTGRGSGGLDGREVEELSRLSKELFNVIQHHIVDEENQLLRLADLHLSALEQDNLAATMGDLEVG
jgi:hemerythrin-like domain-containing protein